MKSGSDGSPASIACLSEEDHSKRPGSARYVGVAREVVKAESWTKSDSEGI